MGPWRSAEMGGGSEDPYTTPIATLHRAAWSAAACATVRASCRFDPTIPYFLVLVLRNNLLRISELGWKVPSLVAYPTDTAPLDYHLLRALSHQLRENKVISRSKFEVEVKVAHFDSHAQLFWGYRKC
ncbi:hypothetical protein RB195_012257 [Necator americanus]|uniref:Uncharacterized protein n=1 Tax=Necator americanus TaxID=51031 RepID=A0ABR1D675_NECAM